MTFNVCLAEIRCKKTEQSHQRNQFSDCHITVTHDSIASEPYIMNDRRQNLSL